MSDSDPVVVLTALHNNVIFTVYKLKSLKKSFILESNISTTNHGSYKTLKESKERIKYLCGQSKRVVFIKPKKEDTSFF